MEIKDVELRSKLEGAMQNSEIAVLLEETVQVFIDAVKKLADFGLDEAARLLIKLIEEKLGNLTDESKTH